MADGLRRMLVKWLDPQDGVDGQVPVISGGRFVIGDQTGGGVQSIVEGTGIIVDDTDPANPIVSATGGGGGGGGTGNDARWNIPTGQTTVDEFNDGTLDAAWTRVDSATAGNVAWGEGADSLAYLQTAGDSGSGAGHALMQPLSGVGGSLANGDGFVACVAPVLRFANYASFGMLLATGVTSGAGNQLLGYVGYDSSVGFATNLTPLTNYNSFGSAASNRVRLDLMATPIWLRLAKVGSTSYRLDISPNGVNWMPGVSAVTNSNAFTHLGFFGTTAGGGATNQMIMIDCIRRVAGVT